MNSMKDLVTWKTCRTCGKTKELTQNYGYDYGRKKKDGTRSKFYDKDCHTCQYRKKHPNARQRRSASEPETQESYQNRYKELVKSANKELHPYLKRQSV